MCPKKNGKTKIFYGDSRPTKYLKTFFVENDEDEN